MLYVFLQVYLVQILSFVLILNVTSSTLLQACAKSCPCITLALGIYFNRVKFKQTLKDIQKENWTM
eukprot:Pgem_evm1s8750